MKKVGISYSDREAALPRELCNFSVLWNYLPGQRLERGHVLALHCYLAGSFD